MKAGARSSKDEIARRVTDAITDVTKLPEGGGLGGVRGGRPARLVRRRASPGSAMQEVTRRDPRPALHAASSAPRSSSSRSPRGCLFTEGPLWHPGGQVPPLERHAGRPPPPLVGERTASPPSASRATSPTASRGTARAGSSPASTPRARSRAPSPTAASRPSPRTTRASSSTAPTTSSARRDGGIYFSDPPYGRAEFYGVKRAAGAAVPGRLPRRRGPEAPGAARRTTSTGPTASASRSTAGGSSSTTPPASTSASST